MNYTPPNLYHYHIKFDIRWVSKARLVVRLQTETGSKYGGHMKDLLQLTRGGPPVWRYDRVLVLYLLTAKKFMPRT
jgi:hypothetical protein